LFGLDAAEQEAIWSLIKDVRARLESFAKVEVFHIGFAESEDAGGHLQVQVVPQIAGEVVQLPGNIEWIKS
jgi:hypothetical protein